jgi:hypothetical protein
LFGESDIMGNFSSLELPSFPGLSWDTSQLLSGVVSVVSGLPGDFDLDGDVDGRGFLKWQRSESPNPLSAGDFADWQSNYGSSSLVAANIAVPEPTTLLFFTATIAWCLNVRRFRLSNPNAT